MQVNGQLRMHMTLSSELDYAILKPAPLKHIPEVKVDRS